MQGQRTATFVGILSEIFRKPIRKVHPSSRSSSQPFTKTFSRCRRIIELNYTVYTPASLDSARPIYHVGAVRRNFRTISLSHLRPDFPNFAFVYLNWSENWSDSRSGSRLVKCRALRNSALPIMASGSTDHDTVCQFHTHAAHHLGTTTIE